MKVKPVSLSITTVDRGSRVAASTVSRRETLRIALTAAALLLVAGCSMFRKSDSDLDTAYRNLRDTLDGIARDDSQQDRLVSIAQRIEKYCRELTREHNEFREQFDALSRKRDTTSSELDELAEGFAARRTVERNDLLRMQDELRAELTEAEWIKAVEALNQTQEAYARPTIGSS
jgi:septal ring factor EnvC (AmiA/AmiB activator)